MNLTTLNVKTNILIIVIHVMRTNAYFVKMISLLLMEINQIVLK